MKNFLLVAQCKHGNSVGVIGSAVGAASLRDFIATPSYVTFVRFNATTVNAYAMQCPDCAEGAIVEAQA